MITILLITAISSVPTIYSWYKCTQFQNKNKIEKKAKNLIKNLDIIQDELIDDQITYDSPINSYSFNNKILETQITVWSATTSPGSSHNNNNSLNEPYLLPANDDIERQLPTGPNDHTRARCHSNRNKFIDALVLKCKAEWGTPEDNKPNRLALRKYINDYLTKRRVRPYLKVKVIPIVIEMVLTPDIEELELNEIVNTRTIRKRKMLKRPSLWDRFLDHVPMCNFKWAEHVPHRV